MMVDVLLTLFVSLSFKVLFLLFSLNVEYDFFLSFFKPLIFKTPFFLTQHLFQHYFYCSFFVPMCLQLPQFCHGGNRKKNFLDLNPSADTILYFTKTSKSKHCTTISRLSSLLFKTIPPLLLQSIHCVFAVETLQRYDDRRNKNKPACRGSLLHLSSHLSEASGLVQPGKVHLSPAKCCQCAWSPYCLYPLEGVDVGFIYVLSFRLRVSSSAETST